MKPHKLTMRAFGSYAGEETLDFTRLGANGLYLIAGETGSGKTTIFDAVSYALFGKASGSARDDYKTLRSDYAERRAKTCVELEFSSGGGKYGIRREITPRVARKTDEVSYTESVSLTLSDGTLLGGKKEVDAKILEIVGLDRSQFAQIVMIAQNDFLRFLQSGTEDRVKILRRIFKTEPLKFFQENLKKWAKEKEDERKAIIRDFEKYEVEPYKRDARFAEWEQLIISDTDIIERTDKSLAENDEISKALAAQIAVAEGLNKSFSGLAAQRLALEAHNASQEEMAAVSARRGRGETALRKVKPFADKAEETRKMYKAAVTDLEKAKNDETELALSFENAKKILAELPPLEAAREEFERIKEEWEQTENKLKKLTEIKGDYDAITKKQAELDALSAELSEIEKTAASLPSLDEERSAFEKLVFSLGELTEKQTALNALKDSYDAAAEKQRGLAEAQTKFETFSEGYKIAKAKYDELYERFLRGQAGVLARSLKEGEPCPVCGSMEHPTPAAPLDGDISESKLKKLNTESEKAKKKLDDITADCVARRAEIDTLTERFSNDSSKLFPETPFEAVGALLPGVIGQTGQSISETTAKKEAGETSLSALASKMENLDGRKEEIIPRITTLRAETETMTDRFLKDFTLFAPDTARNTAGNELPAVLEETKLLFDALSAKKNSSEHALGELKKRREEAAKDQTESESKLLAARTLVSERDKRAEEQKILNGAPMNAYLEALASNGFTDEANYADALITDDELTLLVKSFADYEEDGKQLRRDIARLESETAGKERPDMEKLNAEAGEIKAVTEALRSVRDETKSRLENTSRMLSELKKSAAVLEKTEKEFAALKGLSDTANGKFDFETYAQTAYFERVLWAANTRLKVMSQNRYALSRKGGGGDGRKRAGLEIEVSDSYTGKSRGASSLSGGESFMASLSLALGLSDVVQQSAGGIHLDAMFIDEGFGSLDAEVLELAVRTLSDMAGGNRIIGIISHVAELRERVDKQIRVEKTTGGSKISIVV